MVSETVEDTKLKKKHEILRKDMEFFWKIMNILYIRFLAILHYLVKTEHVHFWKEDANKPKKSMIFRKIAIFLFL